MSLRPWDPPPSAATPIAKPQCVSAPPWGFLPTGPFRGSPATYSCGFMFWDGGEPGGGALSLLFPTVLLPFWEQGGGLLPTPSLAPLQLGFLLCFILFCFVTNAGPLKEARFVHDKSVLPEGAGLERFAAPSPGLPYISCRRPTPPTRLAVGLNRPPTHWVSLAFLRGEAEKFSLSWEVSAVAAGAHGGGGTVAADLLVPSLP